MKYNILELKNIQKEKNTVKSFKVSYKRFEIQILDFDIHIFYWNKNHVIGRF